MVRPILVTGAGGQVGRAVLAEADQRGLEIVGHSSRQLDITCQDQVQAAFDAVRPAAVIHCAAYTAVDRAEQEPERCFAVNEQGSGNVALACKQFGARMLYISTDYIFSGEGETPWQVTDTPHPKNVYGASKYAGERAVREQLDNALIVRTSWVFSHNSHNFVQTILRLAEDRTTINVVTDQIGSPTYAPDLAKLLLDLAFREHTGIAHGTNEGFCSWHAFAEAIVEQAAAIGLLRSECFERLRIRPVRSDDFPRAAQRPANSRLDKRSLDEIGVPRLRDWRSALADCLMRMADSARGGHS